MVSLNAAPPLPPPLPRPSAGRGRAAPAQNPRSAGAPRPGSPRRRGPGTPAGAARGRREPEPGRGQAAGTRGGLARFPVPGKVALRPAKAPPEPAGGGLGSCALGCCTLGSCAQPPAEAPGGGGNRRGQRKIVAHKRNNQPAPQLLEFARRRIWGRPGRAPLACPKTQSCARPRGCGVWRGMCDSPGGLGLVVGCT